MPNLSAAIVSYLIGSLSFTVIVLKRYGMASPHTYGSGNPGATNMLRSGKKRAAALTLLDDTLEGVFVVTVARLLQGNLGPSDGIIAVAAVAVLAGHMQPVFFGFKGGRGVVTVLGVLLTLSWPIALIYAAVRPVMAFGFKVLSLAALTATVVSPLITYSFVPYGSQVAATAIIAALTLYRHKSSVENLLQDKKGKIGDKTKS